MTGTTKIKADISTLSTDTRWVIFDTKDMTMYSTKMSAAKVAVMIVSGKVKNALLFVYFNGYLRLVAKENTNLPGDPFGIKVGKLYDYDEMQCELYDALVKFTNENLDFITEYHKA